MKIPLLLREIEARTEDAADKETVLKILDMEEASISKIIKQIRGPTALTFFNLFRLERVCRRIGRQNEVAEEL
jgi:hypothetical protein